MPRENVYKRKGRVALRGIEREEPVRIWRGKVQCREDFKGSQGNRKFQEEYGNHDRSRRKVIG